VWSCISRFQLLFFQVETARNQKLHSPDEEQAHEQEQKQEQAIGPAGVSDAKEAIWRGLLTRDTLPFATQTPTSTGIATSTAPGPQPPAVVGERTDEVAA
jgi:hypothetical protein